MMDLDLFEIEEAGKPQAGRPHNKVAVNPRLIVSIRAVSVTESRIDFADREPVRVACPYQELIDRLSGSPR